MKHFNEIIFYLELLLAIISGVAYIYMLLYFFGNIWGALLVFITLFILLFIILD